MPDYRPKGLDQIIRPKCKVVYFPLNETDYLSSIPEKDGIILKGDIQVKQIPKETEANSYKVNHFFWLLDQSDPHLILYLIFDIFDICWHQFLKLLNVKK